MREEGRSKKMRSGLSKVRYFGFQLQGDFGVVRIEQ
jgi:hypothetical protein